MPVHNPKCRSQIQANILPKRGSWYSTQKEKLVLNPKGEAKSHKHAKHSYSLQKKGEKRIRNQQNQPRKRKP